MTSSSQPARTSAGFTRLRAHAARLLAAAVFGIAGHSAMATDWYAAPGGSASGTCVDTANACTIQRAINVASAGDTVYLTPGNYPFRTDSGHTGSGVLIEKSIRLVGQGDAFDEEESNRATLLAPTNTGANRRMIYIRGTAVQNVSISNIRFQLNHSRTAEAILAIGSTNGLLIENNLFQIEGTAGSGLQRNAISVNPNNSGDRSVAGTPGATATYGQLSTIRGNHILANGAVVGARGILVELGGTRIENNFIQGGSTNDMRVRWSSGGTVVIENNTFNGRGVNVVEPSVHVTVRGNTFSSPASGVDGATSDASDYYQLRFDGASNPLIQNNTFSGYGRYVRAVYVERTPGAQITNNTFTPKNTGTLYDSIAVLVENKSANTNSPAQAPTLFSATFLRNTFNGNGTANRGYAVGLLNSNDPNGNTAPFGNIVFGSADPLDANNFDGNLQWYIHLAELRCNTGSGTPRCPTSNNMIYRNYGSAGGNANTNTQAWPFRGDVTALNNKFAGKFIDEMTPAEYLAVAAKIQDKEDFATLGTVNFGAFAQITTGTVTFSPATFAYDGTAHTISANLDQDISVPCTVMPGAVSALGDTTVSATCLNTFYNVTGSGTVVVTKGAGTVQLAETGFTYTGNDITLEPSMQQESGASCTSMPATVKDAGEYSISVSCTGTNYDASGSISVNVAKAAGTLAWGPLAFDYSNGTHTVTAKVAEDDSACTVANATIGPQAGSYTVTATACASPNYDVALPVSATATIGGGTAVRRLRDEALFATVAAALADNDTVNGDTLELAPGVHAGPIVLTKGVKLVGSAGYTLMAGPTLPVLSTIDGFNAVSDGIVVNPGVTGASISRLEIRNFTRYCIFGAGGNDGLSVEQNVVHHCADTGMWINGSVQDVFIDHNEVHDFGYGGFAPSVAGRGIVVWNGVKRDITISNNHVRDGAGCCGIELQDGTAAGAWILDNVVERVGDSGMGFIQLTSGSPTLRANVISGNTISDTGRFGIEIKIPNGSGAESGDGAILVEDNVINGAGIKSLRDRAGIAAFRRSVAGIAADATQGVIVRDNEVRGFRTSLAGYEGYGIVVEGTRSRVEDNTLEDNDVGLQIQQGNPDGLPPGDANQDAQTNWFNRGNAVSTCVDLGSNIYNTGVANSLDQRFQVLPSGAPVTGGNITNDARPGQSWCSITAAVAAADDGDTIRIAAVTHAENVVVSRPIKIVGAGQGGTIIVPGTFDPLSPSYSGAVFRVRASNVEISDLTVDGINPALHPTDIAARAGIMTDVTGGPYTNFKVHDTTVQNIYLRGIYAPDSPGGQGVSDFEFVGNTVLNVNSDPSSIAIFSRYGTGLVENNVVDGANDGIAANWSKGVVVRGNTVSNSRSGIHTDNNGGGGGTGDIIENNTVSCGVPSGYGIFVFVPYVDAIVRNNQVGNCAVGLGAFSGRADGQPASATTRFLRNSVVGATYGAWLSTTSFYYGQHDNQVELVGNSITGSTIGVRTERLDGKSLTTTANLNRITGNVTGWTDAGDAVTGSNGASDFTNNWWGCNTDPTGGCAGGNAAAGTGDSDPWLVLSLPAGPIDIARDEVISIAADLNHNSDGAVVDTSALFADGTSIAFAADNGASVTSPEPTTAGVATTTFSGLNAGQSTVTATFDNATANVVVQITPVAITLDGPLTRTYTGSPQVVTATTTPVTAYAVTYDGDSTPPTNVGSYTVVASVTDTCCEGSVTGTLTITPASTTIEFEPASGTDFTYSGGTHAVTARLAAEPGTTCAVTGAVGPNVGPYTVNAVACTGANYTAPASSANYTVSPQPTTITLSYLVQAYDGSPKSVVATTSPTSGLPVSITYNGSPVPPTAIDSYAVVATVTDPNYSGSTTGTLQIVPGTGDIALVLNGPVDAVHVGDVAQYAATMLANPALHAGQTFGYRVVVSKAGGNHPLELADLATMEVFYGGGWVDATTYFGAIPFTFDINGDLVYVFPEGIPGYDDGFPILDPSWTWNFRFTFADTGTYTTTAELVDGLTHAPISPSVTASIATTVVDALMPDDMHLVLGGPVAPVEVGTFAEYNGTLIADPDEHVGETFFVKVRLSRTGGTLVPADLLHTQIYLGGSWVDGSDLGVVFTQDGDDLVYFFPQSQMPGGFPILDALWTWNFRVAFAQAGIYTASAEVIPAYQAGLANPDIYASAAIATTVVPAVVIPPQMHLVVLGPVDDVEVNEPATYTGTLIANPVEVAGRTFWVRVRLSKNGGADNMAVSDLARMELHQGGWQDFTSILQPMLIDDGNDLVYLFPQPASMTGFEIDSPLWTWNFRFTYATTGLYRAVADVIDTAEADPLLAASLAGTMVETNVVAQTPDIRLQLQGPVTAVVGQPAQYVGTLTAGPLPEASELFFVKVRLSKSTGAMSPSDLSRMEILWNGIWVDPVADLGLTLPFDDDNGDLIYLFPRPVMDDGFPIDEASWSWQFRFTYANAAVYTATAEVVRALDQSPVSEAVTIYTDVSPAPAQIALQLNGPVSDVQVDVPAAYLGRLQNLGADLPENGYVKVRVEWDGGPLAATDLTTEIWDGSAWQVGTLTEVADGLEIDFPDASGFAIPAGFDWTHSFRITYHVPGVFHATAAVLGADTQDLYATAEMFTVVVPRSPVTASVLFDTGSLQAQYDGNEHAAVATTLPTGLTLTYSYDGLSTVPTNAGSYVVVATVNDPVYVGSASAILTISKASGTITFGPLSGAWNTAHAVTATLDQDNTATCTVSGVPAQSAPAGSYTVMATCSGDNHAASTTTTYTVAPIAAGSLSLTGGTYTYDGSAKPATVVNPDGIAYALGYDTANGLAPINAGSTTATLTVTDPNYVTQVLTATITIDKASGSVSFGTTTFTFDGTGHQTTAVITEEPGNATACTITSTGDYPRTDAGSSALSATCEGVNHTASGSATLVVAPKPVTIALLGLGSFPYDGNEHAATATVNGTVSGFPATADLTYTPGPGAPVNVGVYDVVATLDPAATNYTAPAANGTIIIGAANATVTLTVADLSQVYDEGNPRVVTATTDPADLDVEVTYDGSLTPPTNAGSYTVVATITEPGYSGSASGTLVVAKAAATVTLDNLIQAYDGTEREVDVETDPTGLAVSVTYNGSATAPSAVGTYAVYATITDANHEGSATATLHITNGAADTIAANGAITFSGIAGAPLAGALPSVRVTDAGGNPVAGVEVTFVPGTASGVLSGAVQTTNQDGIATLGGWTLDAVAGTDTVTATATGVTDEVVFTATSTASAAGLGVTISDGRNYAQFERVLTWAITVGNAGPSSLEDVEVEATLPAELSVPGANWQCIALAGASCTATGTGHLVDSVDLPAGSSVVYLLTALTTRDGSDRIELTVEATGPAGAVSATDTTELVIFRDGFEVGGDGANAIDIWADGIEVLDAGSLRVIDLAHAPAASLVVHRVAEALDGRFRVELIRIGAEAWVRLIARDGTATAWSRVDTDGRIALSIEAGSVLLAGTLDTQVLAIGATTASLRVIGD